MAGLLEMMGLNVGDLQVQIENFVKKFNALLMVEQQNNIMLRYLCLNLLPSEIRAELCIKLRELEE